MDLFLKKHAETRAQQRGFRRADLDLVVRYGTQTRDGVLLRKSDVNNRVSELKHEIGALERLRGVGPDLVNGPLGAVLQIGGDALDFKPELERRRILNEQD